MDIKSVINSVIPSGLRKKEPVEKPIKSDSTTDRDGNGQMPFGQGQQEQNLNEDQFKAAVEYLKSLPVVVEHNLTVSIQVQEGKRFVFLKESNGKVFRRIPESELANMYFAKDKEKGQLLRKTA